MIKCALSAVAVLTAMAARPAAATELLVNGGFETGDFTGWYEVDETGAGGSWFVNNSTSSPVSGFTTPGPASGNFYALTDQGNPSANVLLQPFTISAGAGTVTLSYDFFSNNQNNGASPVAPAGAYCPGPLDFAVSVENQCDRVDIMSGSITDPFDTGSGVVENLYEDAPVAPTDGTSNPWTLETFDLSNLAPGNYYLRFGQVDNAYYNQMGIDNVSITTSNAVPEPGSLALLASGLAGFGLLRRRKHKAT